jgi:hypothetical protein
MGLLTQTAGPARDILGLETIDVVADCGYFKVEGIEACEKAGCIPQSRCKSNPIPAEPRYPPSRFAMSASRRLRPPAARDPMIRQPPEVQKFPQELAGNQDSERRT